MKLNVDFTSSVGKVKPMHEVGQPPFMGMDVSHFGDLTAAHIKYSRLHDTGGLFGGNRFVDIPNIFRDFDADVNDPASYDFAFTDWLLCEMNKAGLEPIYRLGVTIENFHYIKTYRLHPPKDPQKWACICEHIIRHYNEGWANGFKFNIKYWEIWNEADNGRDNSENAMWHGTAEQFFELYAVTAKHLKKVFGDSIAVGGYGSCGFYAVSMNPEEYGMKSKAGDGKTGDAGLTPDRYRNFVTFFENFFAYIKKENAPIDFFSWHSYADVEANCLMADYVDKKLSEYGYFGLYTMCNEWNPATARSQWGTSEAAAKTAAMMLAMQYKGVDMMCYYDARLGCSQYGGLYNPLTFMPTCAYYAMKAFGELFALEDAYKAECSDEGVYALAASNGAKKAVLIANISGFEKIIETNLAGGFKVLLVDEAHYLTEVNKDSSCFSLPNYSTALILCE